MKLFRILILLGCLALSGCQQLLTLPVAFAQSILPVLIQYAPLALMFIEETNDEVHFAEQQKFQDYVQQKLQEDPKNLDTLSDSLQQYLHSNRKWKSVVIMPIQTIEDQKRLQEMYTELSKKGRVHYIITTHDIADTNVDEILENVEIPVSAENTIWDRKTEQVDDSHGEG